MIVIALCIASQIFVKKEETLDELCERVARACERIINGQQNF